MLHVIILLQYATYANKPIETNSGPNPKPLKGKNLPRNAFSFSQVSFCNQSIGEPLNLEECHSPGMQLHTILYTLEMCQPLQFRDAHNECKCQMFPKKCKKKCHGKKVSQKSIHRQCPGMHRTSANATWGI